MSRLALAPAFVGAAWRYWVWVYPSVCLEHRRRRARALEIPDPVLRHTALESQQKWGNVEGAVAFAAFVGRSHRAAATRAMASLQGAYNYLDLLGEQPSADPAAAARRLHEALPLALDPDADRRSVNPDYYEHCRDGYARAREDGGYLLDLIDDCRAALRTLPHYGAIGSTARVAAERIVEFQSAHTGETQGELRALERWGRAIAPPNGELYWWETAAAGGSSLAIYALIALATRSQAPSVAQVRAVHDAYFPWVGALHSLLDNLIDLTEDRVTGQHSLIACYDSPAQAAQRMGRLAERSLAAVRALPDAEAHTLVLGAMASFYLSATQARSPWAAPIADAVRDALDGAADLAMPVFRVRRLIGRGVG